MDIFPESDYSSSRAIAISTQMCAKFLWLSLVIKHWNDLRIDILTSYSILKQSGGIDAFIIPI
jgi:hypothetical protein